MSAARKKSTPRMTLDHLLEAGAYKNEQARAWNEIFGQDARKEGSFHEYTFLSHQYVSERRLEKLRQIELFRKGQQLPDFRIAEDGVKKGWMRWIELEFGIKPGEARDKLKIRQCQLLGDLHRSPRVDRPEILKRYWKPCAGSANRGDVGFFRRLGHALEDPARTTEGSNDFTQVVLAYWLTGFWWLMPLKAIAAEMARIQQKPQMENNYLNRLKKLKSKTRGEWCACLYSASPPLIDCIETDGTPVLTPQGKRLLI